MGRIGIAEEDSSISGLYFETDTIPKELERAETSLIREAFNQVNAYLAGNLKEFSLPLAPQGTEFMQKVWGLLCKIPYGKTASYKEIAKEAGSPKASRAVGLACRRNPIPVFIPCHRVVGSDGKLTGYRGGLALKKQLIELEVNNS